MARFFIDRPIFAWVIAIVLMLAGVLAIRTLPVAQFPAIAAPQIQIQATYPGADAQTLENTTTQIIEQQMKGIDNLRYMESVSSSAGLVTVTLTFEQGTNPDIAQVQVQNKLQAATPLLPLEVQQQGVRVVKSTRNFLIVVGLYSPNGHYSSGDLADYIVSRLQDPLSRVQGVGDTQIFGSQYAMRIWLDPLKLNNFHLTVTDVENAVRAQNAQVSAGQLGGLPAPREQMLNASVSVSSRLNTPDQFRQIRLKSDPGGSVVRLGDVARVEMGSETYAYTVKYNGVPASGMAIKLAPGSNALDTVARIKARMNDLSKTMPAGIKVIYPYDSTPFVHLSIVQVVHTLVIAVVLVFIVMFIFLQNWRATIIPTIAVPVVLLGTFAVLFAAGFSINTLTLFGMVLAIGLLVDDAIVVVENVERLIETEGLSPKEAARKSMDEITGALVGIAMVLAAVFLPMAFFGGSTGVIYRQFSITIVSAMALSVMVALILTPALCATILKPRSEHQRATTGPFGWFNRNFDSAADKYQNGVHYVEHHRGKAFIVFTLLCAGLALLFYRLPTGFLPDEDQGIAYALVNLPPGATTSRTEAALAQVRDHFLKNEAKDVDGVFTVAGFSFAGQAQNAGLAFVKLKPWDERKGAENRLTDIAGIGHTRLAAAQGQLLGMAMQDKRVAGVRPNTIPDQPQLKVDVDQDKAQALGLNIADVNTTISAGWGSAYINDFIDRGRVKRVYLEADTPFRLAPEDLAKFYVRGTNDQMVPFSAFSTTRWQAAPVQLTRYNGLPSIELLGTPGPGQSSGTALKAMEELQAKLPPGTGFEWTGLSYEEKLAGGQAASLYGLSLLIVFLCLAALYESWLVPVSVMLVVPLGVFGAVLAATLTGVNNNIYFQVGLITTIGVSAKNAILIVEFAEERMREGMNAFDAAVAAARLRLRPILMTSFAFIFGVLPLAVASGAGSGGQNAIGRSVVGGMLAATVFGIFFVPMFFVAVRRLFERRKEKGAASDAAEAQA
ncbi:MAG: efflux RND transporter permease subunit [Sphingomonas sp.]|nr:efflux RND transporter permease subunit [Sphingomonas sp.]